MSKETIINLKIKIVGINLYFDITNQKMRCIIEHYINGELKTTDINLSDDTNELTIGELKKHWLNE